MSVNVKCETFSRNVTSGPGMMLPERVFMHAEAAERM